MGRNSGRPLLSQRIAAGGGAYLGNRTALPGAVATFLESSGGKLSEYGKHKPGWFGPGMTGEEKGTLCRGRDVEADSVGRAYGQGRIPLEQRS